MFKLKEILKFFPFARISTVASSLGIWLKLANAGRIIDKRVELLDYLNKKMSNSKVPPPK